MKLVAPVVQIVATNKDDRNFEPDIITDDWHMASAFPYHKTLCGIQLEGDDGYGAGPETRNIVTCGICCMILSEVFRKVEIV